MSISATLLGTQDVQIIRLDNLPPESQKLG